MTVTLVRIEENEGGGGRLGRHVEHDPASLDYPFKVGRKVTLSKVTWPRSGPPFNQGELGSCTGNAICGALNTKPLRMPPARTLLIEKDAVSVYEAATIIDGFPGVYPPTDTGSSGLAVCKVAKKRGLIASYTHAFGITAALAALQKGPVITGIPWYEGFDHPSAQGLVKIAGQVRGGHEIEAFSYDPSTDLVGLWNSWGKGWGLGGKFYFKSTTWAQLLAEQGDVTVPIPKK